MQGDDASRLRIWVDADACPVRIREMIVRAADRVKVTATFVSNHSVPLPRSPHVEVLLVESGFDVADRRIVERLAAGDLVITQDIPLAAEVVERGATALNPRGMLYTAQNVREHLARRNFMEELRSAGTTTRGPSPLAKTDLARFAGALDRFLTRAITTPR